MSFMNLSLLGVIATVWLVIGVFVVAKKYPGYSHRRHFLSELGASQAPTQNISPLINNFPLSILFACFGLYLIQTVGLIAIGLCIVFHALGTFAAGIFPMDSDPYTKNPSLACKIHSLAGMVMFFSLLAASITAIFTARLGVVFQALSVGTSVLSFYFTLRLAQEYSYKGKVGLFQRLGYGVQLLWLSCLSILLFYN